MGGWDPATDKEGVCKQASMVGLDPSHNITYFVAKGRAATNYAQACMYENSYKSTAH